MAYAILNDEQRELLRDLGLPTELSTFMDENDWCDILEILKDEVQLRGINKTGDGENAYGMLCSSVYEAMIDAEERHEAE